MENILPGLAIALLTIVTGHLFQSRREKNQRIAEVKKQSLENLVRSCQQVLDDTSRYADAARHKHKSEMDALLAVFHEHGSAITRTKADAMMIFDREIGDLALTFLILSGETRSLISKSYGSSPHIDDSIQDLNDLFGEVCVKCRGHFYR